MFKKILILEVEELNTEVHKIRGIQMRDLYQYSIAIVKTQTHFRCIKNRFSETGDEKIPNCLLRNYLIRYVKEFTAEELLDSLLMSKTHNEYNEFLKNFENIVDTAFADDGDHDPLRGLSLYQMTQLKNRLINSFKYHHNEK